MNNKTKQGGLGIVSVLTIIFIVLKLLGVIKWSWMWVLSPLWISAVIVVVVFSVILIGGRIKKGNMKVKIIALFLLIAALIVSFVGCSETINEYDKTPLTKLTYTQVDYNGGFTTEYLFDFEKNTAVKHYFLPDDDENDRTEILAEFTDEQEKELINKLYSYGLFDINKEYKSPAGIVDGGGWNLKIEYKDGTSKESSGSNNSPKSVFEKCAKAFYDICGNGVVALVPSEYYIPPNISYALHFTNGNDSTTQGATSLTKRGNYKWNGFEESNTDIFHLNQGYEFPYELKEGTEYEFVLYTGNYGDYDKFKKCEVFAYDYNEQLTGEQKIVDKGWFDQIEFDLELNKVYLIRLNFKNGDFVEYTFNTNVN